MPIASTRPNRDRLFSEAPKPAITTKEPISETGIASTGMIAARQVCRNTTTTSTTRSTASNRVLRTSLIDSATYSVGL